VRILSLSTNVCRSTLLAARLAEMGMVVVHCPDASSWQGFASLDDVAAVVTDSEAVRRDPAALKLLVQRLDYPFVMALVGEESSDRLAAWSVGAHLCLSRHTEVGQLAHALRALLDTHDGPPGARAYTPGGRRGDGAIAHGGGLHEWTLTETGPTLVSPTGVHIKLSYTEHDFLDILMSHHGEVVSTRDGLQLQGRRGGKRLVMSGTLAMLVCRLRRKVARHGLDLPVRSVYGCGYSFIPHYVAPLQARLPPALHRLAP
jgi:DNA-binding response OmpR family regulator